jgi:hypothetical protein
MNQDIWSAYVNLRAAGTSAAAAKVIILTMLVGYDSSMKTAASALMTAADAGVTTQAQLAPYARTASYYHLSSPLQTLETLP